MKPTNVFIKREIKSHGGVMKRTVYETISMIQLMIQRHGYDAREGVAILMWSLGFGIVQSTEVADRIIGHAENRMIDGK